MLFANGSISSFLMAEEYSIVCICLSVEDWIKTWHVSAS